MKEIKNTQTDRPIWYSPAMIKQLVFLLITVGFSAGFVAFLTIWGGRKLDALLGTSPWLTVATAMIGMVSVLVLTLLSAVRFSGKIQALINQSKSKEG